MKQLSEKLDKLQAENSEKLDKLQAALDESHLLRMDPWNDLTATSLGTCTISRAKFASTYGLTRDQIPCMVARIIPPLPTPPSNIPNVKLAHILPRSTKVHIRESLSMGALDVDDLRNMLVLCSGLEESFDRRLISFIPNTDPFTGGFQVKFWKEEFKSIPLYRGSDRTIGEFDGSRLNLIVNGKQHLIFRRALSFQAFMCYNKWKTEQVEGLIFPTNCDLSDYQGSYKYLYKKMEAIYLNQLKKDIKAETEEESEVEDA